MQLTHHDLQNALLRTPRRLIEIMKTDSSWAGKIFVGGGFLRSVITNEPINDVDVFVPSLEDANRLASQLIKSREGKEDCTVFHTDNALTIRGLGKMVQIIHRWVFNRGEDVANSFDFTVCCAVFWWGLVDVNIEINGELVGNGSTPAWKSYCDDRFYQDLAGKRLRYRSPVRNEDAGGSVLRVLKYYQKGYRIPLDSLGAVIARLCVGIDEGRVLAFSKMHDCNFEQAFARIVTGLLREVDPAIDPKHIAHLPSENDHEKSN